MIADNLREDPGLDLVQLVRMHSADALLSRALPDAQARSNLAPLALFHRIGFDEDVHYQLEAVAATSAERGGR